MNKKRHPVIKALQKALVEATGCGIQHDGWPCNTDFHILGPKMGLSNDMTHEFWKIILVLRGDYTEKQVIENQKTFNSLKKDKIHA